VAQTSRLEVIRIAEQAARLSQPFTMIDLAQIDDLMLSVYLCQGTLQTHRHNRSGRAFPGSQRNDQPGKRLG